MIVAAQGGAPAGSGAIDLAALDPATLRLVTVGYGALLALGLVADLALSLRWSLVPQRWAVREARVLRRVLPSECVLHLIVFLFTTFVAGMALQAALAHGMGDAVSDGWFMALHSLTFHWAALGWVVWMLGRRHTSWRRVFGVRWAWGPRNLGQGLLGYFAMVPLFLFMSALYHYALRAVGYDVNLQEVARLITDEPSWVARAYLHLVAVVVAPAVEEILFRGIGLPFLVRRVGVGPAVFVISLLFALIHFHVPSVVPLFVVSLALCVAYVHSGSLLVPIVMHALFNGVNLWMLGVLR